MIITQTPLRLSFLGGNTDFQAYFQKYGGCVLTSAINKYVYCIITERFDDKIYVNWSKKEIVDSVDHIEHELVREAMKKTGVKKGVEITFLADIPAGGSGLGSSSSVLVGVLNALYHYQGQTPTAQQLAEAAVEIEVGKLRKPIGVQDQYIAAYGGLRFLRFQKNGKVLVEKIELSSQLLDDFDNSLMLFYTGRTRQSGEILQAVKKNLGRRREVLGKTKKLAEQGRKTLESGNILSLGKLLNDHWRLKKSLTASISDGEIDAMYTQAKKAGAIGGKIAGAGGGGFLLLMVQSEHRQDVRRALSKFKELPFRLERDGSKVIFNIRRY